jgi:hypothetical protein
VTTSSRSSGYSAEFDTLKQTGRNYIQSKRPEVVLCVIVSVFFDALKGDNCNFLCRYNRVK